MTLASKLTPELLATFRFMHDSYEAYKVVPSVRTIAEARKQGLRATRRQLQTLFELGVIKRSVSKVTLVKLS